MVTLLLLGTILVGVHNLILTFYRLINIKRKLTVTPYPPILLPNLNP